MKIIVGHKGRWHEFHVNKQGDPLYWTLLSGKVVVRVDLQDYRRRCVNDGIEPADDAVRLDCCGFWYRERHDDGVTVSEGEVQYQDFDPDAWASYIAPLPAYNEEEGDDNEDESAGGS